MIQEIAVGFVVLAALAWLGRGWWRKARSKTACGCEHCPVAKPPPRTTP